MRFRVDLKGKLKDRMKKYFERAGWLYSDSEKVDVVISDKPHPLLPTILVGGSKNGDLVDNVLDVLSGQESEDVIKIRVKLYESFLNSGNYESILEEEFARSKRYSVPLSVVIFRILDDDKDAVRCLMSVVKEYGRLSDKMFRVEDGDILVVLVGTDLSGAEVFVRRIKRRYTREYLKRKILKEPDFLWGIGTLEDWMISSDDLLASAEYDLIRKQNRV